MKRNLVTLLIIDPQVDFCDPKKGTLYVPGAESSIGRLAKMIETYGSRIDQVIVTLDSHQPMHISNPPWWRDADGNHPPPFTIIEPDDPKWRPTLQDAETQAWSKNYVRALRKGGRFPHTIWPEHCLIGTDGHAVAHPLQSVLHDWARRRLTTINMVTKGSNPYTEHFGAFHAEVPHPKDPGTQLNTGLVQAIEDSSRILCAGEALTHCLMTSLQQLIGGFQDPEAVRKMELLTDAADPIPDPPSVPDLFSGALKQFLSTARAAGLRETTTTTAF